MANLPREILLTAISLLLLYRGLSEQRPPIPARTSYVLPDKIFGSFLLPPSRAEVLQFIATADVESGDGVRGRSECVHARRSWKRRRSVDQNALAYRPGIHHIGFFDRRLFADSADNGTPHHSLIPNAYGLGYASVILVWRLFLHGNR